MTLIADKEKYVVLGMMSGTSCDGVDVGLIETDGVDQIELGEGMTLEYTEDLRGKIKAMIHEGEGDILQLEKDITSYHAIAVQSLLEKLGKGFNDIDLIGFHGQTIKHMPERGITQQIGNLSLLAHLTRIDVVGDFRRKDMAAGGQGAPLVPVFLQSLAKKMEMPVAFLNIGGISNICYVSEDKLTACDVGPGIGAIDDWVHEKTGQAYDAGGQIASKGKVKEDIVEEVISDTFFSKQPPKSLDRSHFTWEPVKKLNAEDGAATLTEISARGIAKSFDVLPSKPKKLIVSGGGRLNTELMNRIKKLVDTEVIDSDTLNMKGDLMEAYSFGYLAVRTIKRLPITFPGTTSVRQEQLGGVFCPA